VTVEAVLFDWGGTLSVQGDVDLLEMWRAAEVEHLQPGALGSGSRVAGALADDVATVRQVTGGRRSRRMSTRGKPPETAEVSAALWKPARSNTARVPT
jgi:hypothetical protein